MGCGPDVLHLFQLADSVIQQNRQHRVFGQPTPRQVVSSTSVETLRKQLDRMYVEGEVDERSYRALRKLAEAGNLEPVDLAVHRINTHPNLRSAQVTLSEEEKAKRQLRTRLLEIESAREESQRILMSLKEKLNVLEKEIKLHEQAARDAITENEQQARRHLQAKQAFLTTRENLHRQMAALEQDVARLDELYVAIEAKLAELDALEARERLHNVMLPHSNAR